MVGEEETEDAVTATSTSSDTVESSPANTPESLPPQVK